MSRIVDINPEIIKGLNDFNVDKQEAQLYLLGIYFGIDTTSIDEVTRKKVNAMGIVERHYSAEYGNSVKWLVPLFQQEKGDKFSWINDWMDGFKRINPDRRGDKAAVLSRMKKFFAEHPGTSPQDVFNATQAYFRTVSEPQYLKKSHKFIFEGQGFNRSSLLREFLDKIESKEIKSDGRNTKMKG